MVLKAEKSPKWKGDKAGKSAIHNWIKRNYGKANKCENIDCLGKSKKFEWANLKNHKYSHDIKHYKMLCTSCHQIFDGNNKCNKGHEFTENNIYLFPNGIRTCKKCKKETQKLYKIKNRKKINLLKKQYYYRKIHKTVIGG